ncbi:MAG: DUF2238 domain-containing protein [Bdellovibrio sp.]|nr:DUF2238 domain-containing protein [Bdellovibrio sp.]
MAKNYRNQLSLQLLFMAFCLVVTVIGCKDLPTWFLETVPVMIGMILILFTAKRFPLTPLLAILIAGHSLILCIGGHYTYAEVPFGYWMQDVFHFSRNHYDRIGHLAQGFVPAILAREIFIRLKVVRGAGWLFYLVICVCLSFSAFYEFIEWWTALLTGKSSTAFLGTQGDIWDTQWDMFFALVGSILAQVLLARSHDRQIEDICPKNL